MAAARALMLDEGAHALSIAKVATRAGLCKSTVFESFDTRDELLDAVVRDLPLSHECKRVLAYAAEEAERMLHLDEGLAGREVGVGEQVRDTQHGRRGDAGRL